jgi:Arylsulfotransferase (ASST)
MRPAERCPGGGGAAPTPAGSNEHAPVLDRRTLLLRTAGGLAVLVLGDAPRAYAAEGTGFRSRPDLTGLPVVLETPARGTASGYLFLAPFAQGGTGTLAILDSRGSPVWLRPLKRKIAADFRMQRFRGSPVLTWWEGLVSRGGIGSGDYVVLDASYREIVRLRAGNGYAGDLHEFLLTDRGTALVMAYAEAGGLLDCVVQEIDVARGNVVFEWHSVAHVGAEESYLAQPDASTPFDYFHINSVDVDADGHLLVSARNTWAVYKIDRGSGEILWRLGGRRSDFTIGPGAAFAWQHDARRQPDGTLTLFDNADVPALAPQSRGVRLRVDEAAKAADLVAAYARPEPLVSEAMGGVQALPNGNTLVNWGLEPFVTELRPDGTVALDLRLPESTMSYRAYRLPWRGRPVVPPAVALARAGRRVRVFVSWNGSTDTVRWRVLGGESSARLRPLVTVRRSGFETSITLSRPPAYIQLVALDAAGRVLARSRVVRSGARM